LKEITSVDFSHTEDPMKSFRQLSFAAVLTLVLSVSALAGNIGSPGIAVNIGTPGIAGNISTPGIAGNISTPGIAGDIRCPGTSGDILTPGMLSVLISLMGF
jgi:hypothetical protein